MRDDAILENAVVEEAPNQASEVVETVEKQIPQSQVNSLIGRAKQQAYEKAMREAEQKYQSPAQRNEPQEIDYDRIYKQVEERARNEREEAQQQQYLQDVASKFLEGEKKAKAELSDFDEITRDAREDIEKFSETVILLSQFPESGHMFYELARNPEKLAYIDNLAKKSPRLAHKALQKLNKSIVDNKSVYNNSDEIMQPLDRPTPSKISSSSEKSSNIRDLRGADWLRG